MYPANITRAEAAERSELIQTSSYSVFVDITPQIAQKQGKDSTKLFWSHSTVRFSSKLGASFINLIAEEVTEIVLDGEPLDVKLYRNEKIPLALKAGEHQLSIGAWCRYSHTGEGLHRFTDLADGEEYLYTQFETCDARRMYACFEQPDLKANFSFRVRAPKEWAVFSNAPELDSPVLAPCPQTLGVEPAGNFSKNSSSPCLETSGVDHTFATTKRISTYLTALIAGPYHVVHETYHGTNAEIPLSIACRRSLADYVDADRIFATTKAGFEVYETAFNQPYPFEKYDQIFVPEFNFGAMENAGCITFRDEYLFRSKTTQASYESRDNTILHEMAHMWFGDLVTMKWWDDLWLNESFAEWASHWCQGKILQLRGDESSHPWVTFANNRKTWAYRQDQLPSTHPIAADMVDLEAVELNFDGITYAKGASVLKQLVAYVGEEAFLSGLRTYFAKHAWSNSTFADLLAALSEASGRDLTRFANQWLQTTGPNTLHAEFEVDPESRFTYFAIRQTGDTLRQHRLAIGCYDLNISTNSIIRTHRIETDIAGELTKIPELIGLTRPALVLLNDDDLTYAKIRLDQLSTQTVIQHLGQIASPLARALCWSAAWDMCRDGELPAADYVKLVIGAVASETDSTGVGTVLAQAKTAIDFYSPRNQRCELGEAFTLSIYELLESAEAGSDHQLALFRSFVSGLQPFTDSKHIALLQTLLADESNQTTPSGLIIDSDLRWRIVTRLAKLGAIGETAIAVEQARDNTTQGAEKAAGARASGPTAEAKQTAWELAVIRDDTPNETHFQLCSQFWQFDQDAVLEPYIEKYLDVAQAISESRDGWAARSSTLKQHVLGLLFPSPLMSRERLEKVQHWFNEHQLSDSVRRQVSERIDDAERALRCQAQIFN